MKKELRITLVKEVDVKDEQEFINLKWDTESAFVRAGWQAEHTVQITAPSRADIIVVRTASLQEDEGREHYVGSFPSMEEAQSWIAAQTGYFSPRDYYIANPSRSSLG